MAVVRKTFRGTVSNGELTNVTYKGLTSEDSTQNFNICIETTLHFLNSLCQTLIEAGYEDTTVNENEYYITILGEQFYFMCTGCSSSNSSRLSSVNFRGGASISLSNSISQYNTLFYGIVIRGDENHVSIYIKPNRSTDLLSNECQALHIFNMKNVITQNDAILIVGSMNNRSSSNIVPGYAYGGCYIKEKNTPHKISYSGNNLSNIFSSNYIDKANNTSEKVVVTPMTCFFGSYIIFSMIGCTSAIFETGKYYKIGENTYYCEGGSLYKID